jgi:hypothetical protein
MPRAHTAVKRLLSRLSVEWLGQGLRHRLVFRSQRGYDHHPDDAVRTDGSSTSKRRLLDLGVPGNRRLVKVVGEHTVLVRQLHHVLQAVVVRECIASHALSKNDSTAWLNTSDRPMV